VTFGTGENFTTDLLTHSHYSLLPSLTNDKLFKAPQIQLDITSKSKAADEDIQNLSNEITGKWWAENKHRLLDESGH